MRTSPLHETKNLIESAISNVKSMTDVGNHDRKKRALSYLSMALEEVSSLSIAESKGKTLLLE